MNVIDMSKNAITGAWEKTQNYGKELAAVGTGLAVSALSGVASAALPTGATTAFTDVQTDGLARIDLAWPAVIAVSVGFVLLKLFKRAVSKV